MAEEKKGMSNIVIVAILTGVVGIAFVGLQEGKKNDQNRIDNLPAIEQKLESLSKQVENVNNQFAALKSDIKEKDTLFQAQIDRRIERELQGQIDRRLADMENLIDLRFNDTQKQKNRRFSDMQSQMDRRFEKARHETELIRREIQEIFGFIRDDI